MLTHILLLFTLALSPAGSYNLGNSYYNQNDFPRAGAAYQEALKQGPDASVLYNLGNAYFKEGRIGLAVASYQRAQYLSPRDKDIRTNLDFVRNYRADKILTLPDPFSKFIYALFHFFSEHEAVLLALACFILGSLVLALFIVHRRKTLLYVSSLWITAFVFFLGTTLVWRNERQQLPVVITADEVSALSGPGPEYKQIILVHDGTEGQIREARSGYLLVQLPGGIGGWVKKDEVERVF
jgi:tetratricopeptide (TPR) repeat protein